MSKTIYYRQCKLKKGDTYQVSWIPEKFAIKDRILKLKENGKWDNGWIVEFAGQNKISEDLLPDAHNEIKGHRRMTGDVS